MTKTANLSYEQLSEIYDTQIEALLKGDFPKYAKIVEFDRYNDTGYSKTLEDFDSHYSCWDYSPNLELSIFAELPKCEYCASQIEYSTLPEYLALKQAVLKDSEITLPDFSSDYSGMNYGFMKSYMFTRPELEEFKRRQLVARFPNHKN